MGEPTPSPPRGQVIFRTPHERVGYTRVTRGELERQPASRSQTSRGRLQIYPLVLELAAAEAPVRVPVAVTCRVLGFSPQAFYKWKACPVSQRDCDDAHLTNAALEQHAEDPGMGYRLIADELAQAGYQASENRISRLCSQQAIHSVHVRKRRASRTPGPPVHDDLVARDFTAQHPEAVLHGLRPFC